MIDDTRLIKVLHVDDEEDQLLFTKYFLEQLDKGLLIDSVSDPEQVFRLQLNNYDIIISDYLMVNITGIELFNKVRENSDIPFILYTGKSRDEIDVTKVGIEGYLRKGSQPGHYKELVALIRSIIGKRKGKVLIKNNLI